MEQEEMQDKEQYAKALIKKADTAIKVIKGLVIAGGVLAAALLIFGVIAVTSMENTFGAFIGLVVLIAIVAAIFIALMVMFIYAKVNLNKLKKLN